MTMGTKVTGKRHDIEFIGDGSVMTLGESIGDRYDDTRLKY